MTHQHPNDNDDWKREVRDPLPQPWEPPMAPRDPVLIPYELPIGPCDPVPQPYFPLPMVM